VGKGGARERTQFSPQVETELSGLCDDAAGAVHREQREKPKKSVLGQLKSQPRQERKKSALKAGSGMNKLYKVGIYCRLSVDDASNSAKAKNYIPADESVSIENQRELLSKFAMLNGWVETKTYCDDGYSGGNFQRPGFLEMLEDARKGVINLILVKDLSRLGRDFVEVGRYTDVVFPSLGCRFVSVLDCLDSEGDNTDMLHFRSLMNDYHLRDLSSKIKSVLHSKKASGQFVAAYAPYGYRKSAEDKHKLVIDEYAAGIVRRIYDMRLAGTAYGQITATLNREGITSPRIYWSQINGKDSCKAAQERLAKAERLDALLSEVEKEQQKTAAIHNWTAIIRKYLNLQELDQATIDELIDHIEVGERTVVDGQRRQDIKVFYRFVGLVE